MSTYKPSCMVIVYDHYRGHILVPHPMRPGQHPFDILSQYRDGWIRLQHGHSLIPKDVMWMHRVFVQIEPADLEKVREENEALRLEMLRKDLNRDIEETKQGFIYLDKRLSQIEKTLCERLATKPVVHHAQ